MSTDHYHKHIRQLNAEIVRLQTDAAYQQKRIQELESTGGNAADLLLRQQSIIDQQNAHVEALERQIADPTLMVELSNFSIECAANHLRSSVQVHADHADRVVRN